jgi:hypothetical protein
VKRLSLRQKLRQLRIAKWRLQDRIKRKRRFRKRSEDRFIQPTGEIKAPESFNLIRGAGKEVAKFLRAVANRVLLQKKPVTLNFKETKQFYVPGAILLFAELDRVITTSELHKPITIRDPIQRKSREVMKQIGIHNLTNDRCDVVPEREDVVYWKATKGNSQTGNAYGDLVQSIATRANTEHAKHIEVSGLWRSVNEAVANSIDHAYKHPRYDSFIGLDATKWWMFTQIKDNSFTLAVCDLGCGYRKTINETIPETIIAKVKATFVGSNRDALAIDTAMEFGRSGTKLHNRGKGSRDILSLVHKHGSGRVVILSNTGWMSYQFSQGEQIDKSTGDMGIDIGGTIVWWNLPLMEISHDSH